MMKTRIGLAALLLLATGCTGNEYTVTPEPPVNARAIRIGQSVQGITRAAVTDGSSVTATVLMCDGATAAWTGFTPVYKNELFGQAVTVRANVSTATFKAGTGAEVKLNQTLYYPTDNTTHSHLAAVAPAGTLTAGTVVSLNSRDGEQDVMWARAVDAGNGDSPAEPVLLAFEHLTAQLNFRMKLKPAADNGERAGKTVSVKSISIQNAQCPVAVNAADGTVTWTGSAPLGVPGIGNIPLGENPVPTGRPVMVNASGSVTVDVVFTVGDGDISYVNIPIKYNGNDLTTVVGYSHQITLNVLESQQAGSTAVTATATVAPWKTGNPGSADLN
ncbi:MAG: fimbrillin family protein [Bacteroides sp.]|nr:fimbrillin family protein [Bacteroides sp.]